MPHSDNRIKLKKYVGKELRFNGVLRNKSCDKFVIEGVAYNGKILTHHIWVSKTDKKPSNRLENNEITFMGTVKTYIDGKKQRKYGIKKIHSIENKESYEKNTIACVDSRAKTKRKSKKPWQK